MSEELLKFPSLCLQYFKFITFLCEIFPEKVISLEPGLQENLVNSLQLGLTSLGVDNVFTLCCDFIQVLLIVNYSKTFSGNVQIVISLSVKGFFWYLIYGSLLRQLGNV
jgi:hypothetical protein